MDLEQKIARWYARKDRVTLQCLFGLILTQVGWMGVFVKDRSNHSEPIWTSHSDSNGNLILGPGQRIVDAKSIHVEEALWATKALFDRGPTSMDLPELISGMYVGAGLAMLEQLRSNENREFDEKKIHQKAEVVGVEAIETRPNLILLKITGQLVRTGVFQNEPLIEVVPFTLKLSMRPNRDLLKNRRRPLIVIGFQLTYESK